MSFSKKNSIIARSIIMDYYDNPKYKVAEIINDSDYIFHTNNSDSCVDNITLFLKINDGIVENAKYSGIGCAISLSSTEMLLEKIINMNLDDALQIIDKFEILLNGIEEKDVEEILDNLIVFHNIHKQPNRIKCAKIAAVSIREIFRQFKIEK